MDQEESKTKCKTSSNPKTKHFSFKDLSKLVKQASTPSSRRDLLQQIYVPASIPKNPYKTYEKLINSSTKARSSSKPKAKNKSLRHSETTTNIASESKLFQFSPKKSPSKKLVKTPLKLVESLRRKGSEALKKTKRSASKLKQSDYCLSFRTKTGCINGKAKPHNQDDFCVINNFGSCESQTFIGVMDGHGPYGHEVSSFVKKQLPLLVESYLPQGSPSFKFCINSLELLENSFKEGYKNTQKSLVNKKSIDLYYSGSTAVSLLLRRPLCICSNLGDSRAVLGQFKGGWAALNLSQDHKPSNLQEKQRIHSSGGRVEPFREENGEFIGPDRVWLLHQQLPGLAMSRAFGDLVAASVGVTCEPEISIHSLTELDKFLVVATDGVWEFIDSEECVRIVSAFYPSRDVEQACDVLMKKAVECWNREDAVVDDITFVIVFF